MPGIFMQVLGTEQGSPCLWVPSSLTSVFLLTASGQHKQAHWFGPEQGPNLLLWSTCMGYPNFCLGFPDGKLGWERDGMMHYDPLSIWTWTSALGQKAFLDVCEHRSQRLSVLDPLKGRKESSVSWKKCMICSSSWGLETAKTSTAKVLAPRI